MNTFKQRDLDWRVGRIVYQVFVDRFAPSHNLEAKRHFYPSPKTLKPWSELPSRGVKSSTVPHYTHELDFWGGDLPSLTSHLSYLQQLGVDTLYLNPIFDAYTNHKYDTKDYLTISPEYGTMDDFKTLLHSANTQSMHVVLDGVFNHMSYHSPIFQDARHNPSSEYRSWFVFGEGFRYPYRAWHNAESLPELDLTNPMVRQYLFKDVVQHYLQLGLSGWRLDTAIELGYTYLKQLTDHAHAIKPDSLVVGEINNYPSSWVNVIDGTLQLPLRDWMIQTALGNIPASLAMQQLDQYILDTGIEAMLTSWILLENHDVPRTRFDLHDEKRYRFAKWLSVTLPGNLHVYQGEEYGLHGGTDPLNREPFPWHLTTQPNAFYDLHKAMIRLRKQERALRIGNYKKIVSQQLIAFLRTTDDYRETLVILANPSSEPVTEWVLIPEPSFRGHLSFYDLITNLKIVDSWGIYVPITVQPHRVLILKPNHSPIDGYSPTKYN
jgi:glycosidase